MTGHSLDDHGIVNGERKDGRGGEKTENRGGMRRNENRGHRDPTVTSNKAMFTKNTHISFPPLSSQGDSQQKQPGLPPPPSHECQASDQEGSAYSCPGQLSLGHKHSTHILPGETEWEGDP